VSQLKPPSQVVADVEAERWFAFLTSQLIRRGVHKSVPALEADIRAWTKIWCACSGPGGWT
jgi:hypothetical protein